MGPTQPLPLSAILLLGGATLAFYIASRAGADALASRRQSRGVGGRTLAQWLPIATLALIFVPHDSSVSISVIFASSVAALSLVLGTILFSTSPATLTDAVNRRAWPMVLPAAVLTLLIGFSGQFALRHVLFLGMQGGVALLLWLAPVGTATDEYTAYSATSESTSTSSSASPASTWRPVIFLGIRVVCSLLLTLLGAWLALRAVAGMTSRVPHLSGGLIGALMLAPALMLPMIGSGLALARGGRTGDAVSTCVGCVLLNLCGLLPLTIALWHVAAAREQSGSAAILRGEWMNAPPAPLPFPMAVWRIDTVLLIMLGALLLPASIGRWVPRHFEGFGLILAYCLYMYFTAAFAAR